MSCETLKDSRSFRSSFNRGSRCSLGTSQVVRRCLRVARKLWHSLKRDLRVCRGGRGGFGGARGVFRLLSCGGGEGGAGVEGKGWFVCRWGKINGGVGRSKFA